MNVPVIIKCTTKIVREKKNGIESVLSGIPPDDLVMDAPVNNPETGGPDP
jgi:hypothetical protein